MRKRLKKVLEWVKKRPYCIRRFWVRRRIKDRDFSIISNNCWAGRAYQYLDMPYLSPTAGLYFFADDYLKFISDLRRYLDTPLRFIPAEESKYYEELKRRNQTGKPIGVLDDVEIVFLHYSTAQEAEEKWNRRKARVNYDHLIFKFSKMNLCTDDHIERFDALPLERKFVFNNRRNVQFNSEIYYRGYDGQAYIDSDTQPFPGKINLVDLLRTRWKKYDKWQKDQKGDRL